MYTVAWDNAAGQAMTFDYASLGEALVAAGIALQRGGDSVMLMYPDGGMEFYDNTPADAPAGGNGGTGS